MSQRLIPDSSFILHPSSFPDVGVPARGAGVPHALQASGASAGGRVPERFGTRCCCRGLCAAERLPVEEPLCFFVVEGAAGGVAGDMDDLEAVVLQQEGGFESAGEIGCGGACVDGIAVVLGEPLLLGD